MFFPHHLFSNFLQNKFLTLACISNFISSMFTIHSGVSLPLFHPFQKKFYFSMTSMFLGKNLIQVQGAYLHDQLLNKFFTSHIFHNHQNQLAIQPKAIFLPIQLGIFMLNHKIGFFLLLELTHQEEETKQVHQFQILDYLVD